MAEDRSRSPPSRSPPRVSVAAGDDRLLFMPRDSLSLLAYTRSGEPAWSREAITGRHLSAVSSDGSIAITEWLVVEAINTSDGSLRWRYQPRDTDNQCVGHALIVGQQVLFSTDKALYRLNLDDGRLISRQSWDAMGLAGPVATWLFQTAHGLYGVGNNQLVCYTAAAATPGVPAKPPGIERDSDIPSAHWPAAPAGSPFGIDWRMAGDEVRQIDVPDGTPPGECFVRFAHSMALIDVPKHKIVWRVRLSVDTRAVGYSKDLILCLHYAGTVALDRTTGQLRWTNDYAQSILDALKENGGQPPMVWAGDDVLIVCRYWSNQITIFSLQDGHQLGGYQVDGNPCAGCEWGGQVWICVRRGDTMIVDSRDIKDLNHKTVGLSGLPCSDRDGGAVADHGMILHNHTQAVYFDFKTGKPSPYPFVGDVYCFYQSEGHPMAFVHCYDDHWYSAVMDPDNKPLFQEVTINGGGPPENRMLWAYHFNGQHLIRLESNRNNIDGVFSHSFPENKEQWFIPGREVQNRLQNGITFLEHYTIISWIDIEGGMNYRCIDSDTGKVTAEGPIPGWFGESLMPMQVLGGEWIYGTDQGLFCLQPTTSEALKSGPADGSIPMLALAPPIEVPTASGPMIIDGHLDDWKGVEPKLISVPAGARSGGGSALPLEAKAAVRMCVDADAVYVAVEVAATHLPDPVAGAHVFTGDGLAICIDPKGSQWRQNGQVVACISLINGETVLYINGNHETLPGLEHAHARAARSIGGVAGEPRSPGLPARRSQQAARRHACHGHRYRRIVRHRG